MVCQAPGFCSRNASKSGRSTIAKLQLVIATASANRASPPKTEFMAELDKTAARMLASGMTPPTPPTPAQLAATLVEFEQFMAVLA
jgi:hypothetical protein